MIGPIEHSKKRPKVAKASKNLAKRRFMTFFISKTAGTSIVLLCLCLQMATLKLDLNPDVTIPKDSDSPAKSHRMVIGAAEFVGMHVFIGLLRDSNSEFVLGMDSLKSRPGMPSELKQRRKDHLEEQAKKVDVGSRFVQGEACNQELVQMLLLKHGIDTVYYFEPESVEYSSGVSRPFRYPLNNLDCIANVLEPIRKLQGQGLSIRLVYIFGGFSLSGTTELILRSYNSLYSLNTITIHFNTTILGTYGVFEPDVYTMIDNLIHRREDKIEDGSMFSLVRDVVRLVISSSINTSNKMNKNFVAVAANIVTSMNRNQLSNMLKQAIDSVTEDQSGDQLQSIHYRVNDPLEDSESLKLEITEFVQWFLTVKDQKFLSNRTRTPKVVQVPRKQLCFVTSMFTDNATKSDPIVDVSEYDHNPPFRYFFFTNIPENGSLESELPTPGWERIVIPDFPFKRMITQSRWPKFMGWMHPGLQECRVVVYSDAIVPPRNKPLTSWKILAAKAISSPTGLYQRENIIVRKRNITIFGELDRIVQQGKDTKVNVERSKEWFEKQDGFSDEVKGYYNMFLICDPTNSKFQELMTTFWAAYSSEEMSWRDQPLYRHIVNKLRIFPSTSGRDKLREYFPCTKSTAKAHKYVDH